MKDLRNIKILNEELADEQAALMSKRVKKQLAHTDKNLINLDLSNESSSQSTPPSDHKPDETKVYLGNGIYLDPAKLPQEPNSDSGAESERVA
eukprot:CAMPEP_0170511832 /NCGR_PEP_ID=MMETSP0208-20121228/66517_1 /TAXON_ID=197538 /ORGANISM="Strombidium inclinatum, Strain S3" /LENGTH=92 /DNA_ID=CAMNT_0010795401 /DNA_START=1278 /DNA_END=1555 /DNA_ORIENTATION=-